MTQECFMTLIKMDIFYLLFSVGVTTRFMLSTQNINNLPPITQNPRNPTQPIRPTAPIGPGPGNPTLPVQPTGGPVVIPTFPRNPTYPTYPQNPTQPYRPPNNQNTRNYPHINIPPGQNGVARQQSSRNSEYLYIETRNYPHINIPPGQNGVARQQSSQNSEYIVMVYRSTWVFASLIYALYRSETNLMLLNSQNFVLK